MSANKPKDIVKIFAEGTAIDNALRAAVRDALWRHKQLGQPVVVWRKGRAVWLSPEQIPVEPRRSAKPARRVKRKAAGAARGRA